MISKEKLLKLQQEEEVPQYTKEQLRKRAIAQINYNKLYTQMNGGFL